MKKILILLLLIISTATANDVIKYKFDSLILMIPEQENFGIRTKSTITISGNSMKIRVPEYKKNKLLNIDFKVVLNELDSNKVRKLRFENKNFIGAGYCNSERITLVIEGADEVSYTYIFYNE